ncbi:MAG TPA: tRNA (adenosine(37)-N6)-threonylcarbamoyltransferase complex dimerization subunit type 1 TsaB [Methylocystis sp.]|nr:tRNA (adenosine(37)-N6)-threonylcarbamoyltransferase complex dimerization subunit type 1 TsaB [Methylocystis sp.]
MRLLAIDTALPAVSACVFDSGASEPLAVESQPMERGHAEALLPLVERVVSSVEGGLASIDRIAVTVGPGSFTGVRIGLAAAQAIALARKIELVGVSTLAALAAPNFLEPFEGVVAAAIDARHGQVYVAAFGPDGRLLVSPRRVGVAEALRALGDCHAGPEEVERRPLRLVGSGAPLLEAQARASGLVAVLANASPAPDITFVARLGIVANASDAPARPLYLKPPDAKPAAKRSVIQETAPEPPEAAEENSASEAPAESA